MIASRYWRVTVIISQFHENEMFSIQLILCIYNIISFKRDFKKSLTFENVKFSQKRIFISYPVNEYLKR